MSTACTLSLSIRDSGKEVKIYGGVPTADTGNLMASCLKFLEKTPYKWGEHVWATIQPGDPDKKKYQVLVSFPNRPDKGPSVGIFYVPWEKDETLLRYVVKAIGLAKLNVPSTEYAKWAEGACVTIAEVAESKPPQPPAAAATPTTARPGLVQVEVPEEFAEVFKSLFRNWTPNRSTIENLDCGPTIDRNTAFNALLKYATVMNCDTAPTPVSLHHTLRLALAHHAVAERDAAARNAAKK